MPSKRTKISASKEDLKAVEKKVREAAPPESLVFPVSLRSVYQGRFENFFAVCGAKGLRYLVDKEGQTVEIETYRALNPKHMVFSNVILSEMYRLYR